MRILRWCLPLAFWLVVFPLMHGVLPWAMSTLASRHGWSRANMPGTWNWIGLIPVTIATSILIWISAWKWWPPERVMQTPSFLLVRGPYRFTRNPIYIAYLGIWFGWAIFFGSVSVLIVWMLWCLVATLILVPREEHDLEGAFGESYLQYKSGVPRWFGKSKTLGHNHREIALALIKRAGHIGHGGWLVSA
jgi:protein-S-isoprenylcysteine O-methyltransferase Ste14